MNVTSYIYHVFFISKYKVFYLPDMIFEKPQMDEQLFRKSKGWKMNK